jgi:hypothetical protein
VIVPYTAGNNGPYSKLERRIGKLALTNPKSNFSQMFNDKVRHLEMENKYPSTFFEEDSIDDDDDTPNLYSFKSARDIMIHERPVTAIDTEPTDEVIRRCSSYCDPLGFNEWTQQKGDLNSARASGIFCRTASAPAAQRCAPATPLYAPAAPPTAPLCEAERCSRDLPPTAPRPAAATYIDLLKVIDAAASDAAKRVPRK